MDLDDLRDHSLISAEDHHIVLSACETHADHVHPDRDVFLPTTALCRPLVLRLTNVYSTDIKLREAGPSTSMPSWMTRWVLNGLRWILAFFLQMVDGKRFWLLVYVNDLIQIAFDEVAIKQFQDELDHSRKFHSWC